MGKQKCGGAMVFYYRSARSTHKMSFSKKSMFDITLCRSKNVLAQIVFTFLCYVLVKEKFIKKNIYKKIYTYIPLSGRKGFF